MKSTWPIGKMFIFCVGVASAISVASDPVPDFVRIEKTKATVDRGLRFLITTQRADGGWASFDKSHPAVTALIVQALVQDPAYDRHHPAVQRGIDFMLRYVHENGGVYVDGEGMRNYHTSVVLMALAATEDPAHAERIQGAQRFLKKLQWDVGEGYEASSPWFGGQGYGKHKRPDLSNTQMMLEALQQSGLPADDPVYQRALVFVGRCQKLDDTNDQPLADGATDGGFIYTPVNGGESKAGTEVLRGQPRLRSYGSMTYAGFKSMLYAKVDREDPRVQAVARWISKHYTLDHNPNMPGVQSRQGLYYYYHVFAQALQAWGQETIKDATGRPHAWRDELCEKLISLQRADGSWVNERDRWYEGNPHLVTAYAILTIQKAVTPSSRSAPGGVK